MRWNQLGTLRTYKIHLKGAKKEMSKNSLSNGSVQPSSEIEMDTLTMGDRALEQAERNKIKKPESGAN